MARAPKSVSTKLKEGKEPHRTRDKGKVNPLKKASIPAAIRKGATPPAKAGAMTPEKYWSPNARQLYCTLISFLMNNDKWSPHHSASCKAVAECYHINEVMASMLNDAVVQLRAEEEAKERYKLHLNVLGLVSAVSKSQKSLQEAFKVVGGTPHSAAILRSVSPEQINLGDDLDAILKKMPKLQAN